MKIFQIIVAMFLCFVVIRGAVANFKPEQRLTTQTTLDVVIPYDTYAVRKRSRRYA